MVALRQRCTKYGLRWYLTAEITPIGAVMDFLIEQPDNDSDELRDLYQWLTDEPALDAVREVRAKVAPGSLGGNLTGLFVQVAPEAGPALATVLVTWLRNKRGYVRVSAKNGTSERTFTMKGDGSNKALNDVMKQFMDECINTREDDDPEPHSTRSVDGSVDPATAQQDRHLSRRSPRGWSLRKGPRSGKD